MRLPALALILLATSLGSAAQAQQCGNLVRAMSLDVEDHGSYFTVPVTVNGQPKQFLLDTGGAFTQIAVDTTRELGLKIQPSRVVMYDMYGNTNAGQVTADVGVGRLTAKAAELPVIGIRGVDGIFAADFMQNYDIDVDFAGRKLNYFLTDHCDGRVVYWPAGIIASVPFHGWNTHGDSHMNITVKLDGHEMPATIDTGASTSTLESGTARQLFGVTPDSPGVTKVGTDALKEFAWTFKTLEIGGITVRDPEFAVIKDRVGKNDRDNIAADSRIQRITDGMAPTMLIGMNVLRKLHLYIAFKERKLYVTAGSDQVTQRAPAAAPAAH